MSERRQKMRMKGNRNSRGQETVWRWGELFLLLLFYP